MLSDVLKGLLKTVYFPNSVKHYLNALICSAICFLYEKSFAMERSFPAFVDQSRFSGGPLDKGIGHIWNELQGSGFALPKGGLPGPGQEGIFTYFRAVSLTQPSAHPQTQECAP